ncbi:MAG: glycoside hydrolase family 2 protein [candidate division KSB1 bacterium]|nr:glycoside hydrolase family 2 protein [candidate division KSB1 bacterium]
MFQDILISPIVTPDSLEIYLVSDKQVPVKGKLTLELLDFSGSRLNRKVVELDIPENASEQVFRSGTDQLLSSFDKSKVFVKACFTSNSGARVVRPIYFVPEKELSLEDPGIKFKLESKGTDEYKLVLAVSSLARDVYVRADSQSIQLDDNFIDIIPGESRPLIVTSKKSPDQIRESLVIRSLYDTYNE